MQTATLIKEIKKLPLDKKFLIIELTLKAIKKEETAHQMSLAVNELYDDYAQDADLTAFTQLDFEKFYETR
ncbi:hypothetical protein [Runella sp.]|jgi:Cdc6-like AAA superfamily ATPase|uniref:hypothetical protein n=1 Tax=Runella sp. TaxID=1960881 RepID=UPI00262D6E15|nr:hypothetical protein [Runella sp.]